MTDIRTRGFSSPSDFEDRMEEIDATDDFALETRTDREAEIELVWLRKEVEDLREQLAVARGRPALGETFVEGRDRCVRVATALTAAFVCVVLAKRV